MKDIIKTEAIQKILVTRTDRIGDVLLSTPVFKSIKERFPAAKLYAVVLPGTREILEGNPYIDSIIVYDKRGKERSFLGSLIFALSLRKEKIDCAIHLHPTNRVHVMSFVAGIPVRIGYKRKLNRLLTHAFPERKREGAEHEAEYNYDLLQPLGIRKPETLLPFFSVTEKDEKALQAYLKRHALSLASYVCLFPSASCRSKMWPLESFALLAERLVRDAQKTIVIVGGKDAKAYAADIKRFSSVPLIDLTGELGLKELGALFKGADLVVSNDSGPAHIAASMGTPVIAIFGRKESGLGPKRWRPLGEKSYFIQKESACTTCLAHNCEKEFLCLRSVTVDDIFALIKEHALFV
jgi:lipopolysaccharide heptosyltransferase II